METTTQTSASNYTTEQVEGLLARMEDLLARIANTSPEEMNRLMHLAQGY